MSYTLEKHFEKIGAKLKFVKVFEQPQNRRGLRQSPYQIDIINQSGVEMFEIQVNGRMEDNLEFSVLEVKPQDRHLVLLAREVDSEGMALNKEHFLCGHDERHLFVASVAGVSTVDQAKDSLKPRFLRLRETGMNAQKRHRRKTKNFKRQGEWFFIPDSIEPDESLIIRNEPLSRGRGSKPHMAQYCYRSGGELVKVSNEYPNGVTLAQYNNLVKRSPRLKHLFWYDRRRGAEVYVKGKVRHEDHATITLNQWHMVLMNTEETKETVVFLD